MRSTIETRRKEYLNRIRDLKEDHEFNWLGKLEAGDGHLREREQRV